MIDYRQKIIDKLQTQSKLSLSTCEFQEINDLNLDQFNAIGYMGNKFSYVYSTYDGKLLHKMSVMGDKNLSHVEKIFKDIEQTYQIANSKVLIYIEEDYVIYDLRNPNFRSKHCALNSMENNGCKIIKSAQYHCRFGFKIPTNLGLKDSDRKSIYNLYNHRCVYCNKKLRKDDFQIDHIVPKNEGGNNYYKNWALTCEECNEDKNNLIFSWNRNGLAFKGKMYLIKLTNNYHFYKIKIGNDYRLVRKQKNFDFKAYFTIYQKVNNIYVNRDNIDSGYQFIINITNSIDLEEITENGKKIDNKTIENILGTQRINKCSTKRIDDWLK